MHSATRIVSSAFSFRHLPTSFKSAAYSLVPFTLLFLSLSLSSDLHLASGLVTEKSASKARLKQHTKHRAPPRGEHTVHLSQIIAFAGALLTG